MEELSLVASAAHRGSESVGASDQAEFPLASKREGKIRMGISVHLSALLFQEDPTCDPYLVQDLEKGCVLDTAVSRPLAAQHGTGELIISIAAHLGEDTCCSIAGSFGDRVGF
jgi:hypothetical protein